VNDVLATFSDSQGAAQVARWAIVLAAAGVAAVTDARTRRIPNVLTFPLLACGLLAAFLPVGNAGIADALLGMLLLGVPYFFLFVFAGGGAGDAKMMGAIGAWVGFAGAIPVLVGVAILGGVLAVGYAILRRRLKAVGGNLRLMTMGVGLMAFHQAKLSQAQDLVPERREMLTMPYGVSIFVGTLAAAGWVFLWH
jgi:prepilin peptidase CpaA